MENKKLIKSWRLYKGLSQQGLSDSSGIPRTTINNWETGKNFPQPKKINQLLEAFGITLEEFRNGPNDNYDTPVQPKETAESKNPEVPEDITIE
jgi:transcriptional regulator with XRE-family HTH domain